MSPFIETCHLLQRDIRTYRVKKPDEKQLFCNGCLKNLAHFQFASLLLELIYVIKTHQCTHTWYHYFATVSIHLIGLTCRISKRNALQMYLNDWKPNPDIMQTEPTKDGAHSAVMS